MCKVKQLESTKEMLIERGKDSEKMEEEIKKLKIKPKKKDILLGVTQEELNEALNIRNVEHDIDEEERLEEEEEEESLRNRQKYRQ